MPIGGVPCCSQSGSSKHFYYLPLLYCVCGLPSQAEIGVSWKVEVDEGGAGKTFPSFSFLPMPVNDLVLFIDFFPYCLQKKKKCRQSCSMEWSSFPSWLRTTTPTFPTLNFLRKPSWPVLAAPGCAAEVGANGEGCEPLDVPRTLWVGKTKQTLGILSANQEVVAPREGKANSKLFPVPSQDLSVFWFATLPWKSFHFPKSALEL